MREIDRDRLATPARARARDLRRAHIRARASCTTARAGSLIGGVPMPWMMRWAGGYPVFAARGAGRADRRRRRPRVRRLRARRHRRDGRPLARARPRARPPAQAGARHHDDAADRGRDLGRRGAHAPLRGAALAVHADRDRRQPHGAAPRAPAHRAPEGPRLQLLLPRLRRRGVRRRARTARTVAARGQRRRRRSTPARRRSRSSSTTSTALERALATGEVAVVLAEPAMTNMGIVLPDDGYHEALRELTRAHGTLLIIDETHTFSAGPGGCTQAWDLEPDILDDRQGDRRRRAGRRARASTEDARRRGCSPTRTPTTRTPAASAARSPATRSRSAAMRATLEHVLHRRRVRAHDPARDALRRRRRRASIDAHGVPWNVTQLGCRAEYQFLPEPARNGTIAARARTTTSSSTTCTCTRSTAACCSRRSTTWRSCARTSTAADVDRHTEVFDEAVAELVQAPSRRLAAITARAAHRRSRPPRSATCASRSPTAATSAVSTACPPRGCRGSSATRS